MKDGATSCAELSSVLILTDHKILFMSKMSQIVKTIKDFFRLYFPILICHQGVPDNICIGYRQVQTQIIFFACKFFYYTQELPHQI